MKYHGVYIYQNFHECISHSLEKHILKFTNDIENLVQNNIDMRDKVVEAKLREIGKRYYKKMRDQLTTSRKNTQT